MGLTKETPDPVGVAVISQSSFGGLGGPPPGLPVPPPEPPRLMIGGSPEPPVVCAEARASAMRVSTHRQKSAPTDRKREMIRLKKTDKELRIELLPFRDKANLKSSDPSQT